MKTGKVISGLGWFALLWVNLGWCGSLGSQVWAADSESWHREASDLVLRGDYAKAIGVTEARLEEAPRDWDAHFMKGKVLDYLRKHEEAARSYTVILDQAPNMPPGHRANLLHIRADAWFKSGRFEVAITDYDASIELQPHRGPQCWQRGIALYYAGRFEEGKRQFESHQAVNPNDVENAVWHFMCVLKLGGLQEARKSLIPIQGDPRAPMAEVHELFAGKCLPQTVIQAAENATPSTRAQFYAHLYAGLYFDAVDEKDKALSYISLAAKDFERHGFMGDVARIHLKQIQPQP